MLAPFTVRDGVVVPVDTVSALDVLVTLVTVPPEFASLAQVTLPAASIAWMYLPTVQLVVLSSGW